MRMGGTGIETAVEFPHGRAEIRSYDWRTEWTGIQRARPDMYVLELNLSRGDGSGRSEPRRSGDVAVIHPHGEVDREIASGRRRTLLCMLDRAWLESLFPPLLDRGRGDAAGEVGLGRIEWLLRNIHHEMRREPDFGSVIVIEAFAHALAVELARRLASREGAEGVRRGGLAPWRMRLLQERILADAPAPSLAELAGLCDMTVRHLCRVFKAETGSTLGLYVERARAQRAQTLLSKTDLTLAEIAHRLGFASSTSFANAFQRATGLKPREIRRSSKLRP